MSADNSYFVVEKDGTWSVSHGFMSPFCEQEVPEFEEFYGPGGDGYTKQLFDEGKKFNSRAEALIYAHDRVAKEAIVEYGVTEVSL